VTKLFRLPSSWSRYCRFIGFANASSKDGSIVSFTDVLTAALSTLVGLGCRPSPLITGVACLDVWGDIPVGEEAFCCRLNNCTGPLDAFAEEAEVEEEPEPPAPEDAAVVLFEIALKVSSLRYKIRVQVSQ